MREAVQKLVDDHIAVAAQYEAVGDADSAARLRAVANMVAALLHGKDAGTLLPSLTDADRAAIKAKESEFQRMEEEFKEVHQGAYDELDDVDYECAHFEAARRVIDIMVRKPQAAPLKAWLSGIEDAADYLRRDNGSNE